MLHMLQIPHFAAVSLLISLLAQCKTFNVLLEVAYADTPVTSVFTRWPSYLSPRSAGLLTARTLKSLDNSRPVLRIIVSHATRENSQSCRPRAVIGRQRLSLRSSRQ